MNHPPRDHDTTAIVRVRGATVEDLAAINAVVERALMSWDLSDRVKRLSLPAYRYDRHDFEALGFRVAVDAADRVVGVAAWDTGHTSGPPGAGPGVGNGVLLHGLYVDPHWHGRGVGSRLFAAVVDHAREGGHNGLLVRAQSGARGFFEHMGMRPLPATDEERDYAHRYWLPLSQKPCRE